MFPGRSWANKTLRHSAQQRNDASNCGVICAQFAQFLWGRRRSLSFRTDAESMLKERRNVWREILESANNVADLCFRCGEEDCPLNTGGVKDSWVRDINCKVLLLRDYTVVYERKVLNFRRALTFTNVMEIFLETGRPFLIKSKENCD